MTSIEKNPINDGHTDTGSQPSSVCRREGTKFSREEEMAFRIQARRNKLLGIWASEHMHLSPVETEAYAKGVLQSDFEEWSEEDIIRKILGDLILAGVEAHESDIRDALGRCETDARRMLIGEV